jgi:hypothetical protein
MVRKNSPPDDLVSIFEKKQPVKSIYLKSFAYKTPPSLIARQSMNLVSITWRVTLFIRKKTPPLLPNALLITQFIICKKKINKKAFKK